MLQFLDGVAVFMDLRILTFHCYLYRDEQPNVEKSTNIFPEYPYKGEKEIN